MQAKGCEASPPPSPLVRSHLEEGWTSLSRGCMILATLSYRLHAFSHTARWCRRAQQVLHTRTGSRTSASVRIRRSVGAAQQCVDAKGEVNMTPSGPGRQRRQILRFRLPKKDDRSPSEAWCASPGERNERRVTVFSTVLMRHGKRKRRKPDGSCCVVPVKTDRGSKGNMRDSVCGFFLNVS